MEFLRLVLLCAALWVAVAGFPSGGPRFVLGLTLGAGLAHLGWGVLHLDRLLLAPDTLLNPASGHSVLFVPLGPLLTAPWRGDGVRRERYLAGVFRALPAALATARLGCLVAGCCRGAPGPLAWAPARHPTQLYEIVCLLALLGLLRKLPAGCVAPVFLAAFGLLRLATQPLRAAPPLSEPLVPPEALAAAWLGIGALWLAARLSAGRERTRAAQ